MRGKLSDRLAQMRKIREEGGAQRAHDRTKIEQNGSRQEGGERSVHEAREAGEERAVAGLFDSWRRVAPLVLGRSVTLPFPRLESIEGELEPARPYRGLLLPKERLGGSIFYDFETTGLSGGAGTYIFLAGIGRFTEEGMRIDQLFLEDYPGEPEFLEALRGLFGRDETCISYNGKRFDANLLLTRSRMSGVEVEMGSQLDLLYPVRNIWKRSLGSCRLSRVERHVLDRGRIGDIDGALIPDCYFSFLRQRDQQLEDSAGGQGELGCMQMVIDHHLKDIESLAHLLFTIEEAAAEPRMLRLSGAREGMAALLLKRGDPRGAELLEEELEEGSMRAGRLAALYYRRAGNYGELERVLSRMWRRERGFFQGVALAKLYEHRRGEPGAALEIVRELDSSRRFLPSGKREELEKRRLRLERKLERNRIGSAGGNP